MDTKTVYERLDALAEALERDGGTHGTDELVQVLTDVLGLSCDMVTPRHTRTPVAVWSADWVLREEARRTATRWLRDGGHIPPAHDIR